MDILTDRTIKNYSHISRYSVFPYYYHILDEKYIYGITGQLKQDTSYALIDVNMNTTLENLAARYYGRPDYYWIIADFNHIQDPFIQLYPRFKKIKIPSIAGIEFERQS